VILLLDLRKKGAIVSVSEPTRFSPFPSASGGITRLAYAQAKAAGLDAELLLTKAGLTFQQVDDPEVRLKVHNQIGFLNLTAKAIPDDFLGFHLALPSDLRQIGLLYYVSATSDTLVEALRRAARYSSIVNEGVSLRFRNGEDVAISFEYVGVSRHLDRHQIEFFVTTLVRICRQLTGRHLVPTSVRMIHRRDSIPPELVDFFGKAIEFGADVDEVVFADLVKALPVVSADPYLNKLLIKYCDEALDHRQRNLGSFRSAVENAVAPLLPHGKARADEIARRLGVSQRTFARRLSMEGVTFSEVLTSLRSNLAERYLADGSLSISKIAWLLGYQEVSAFTHAFKRRTGRTPREARASINSALVTKEI